MPDLSANHLAYSCNTRFIAALAQQYFRARANWRERIAQFMREHGEELVLAAVRLPQRLFGKNLGVNIGVAGHPLKDFLSVVSQWNGSGQ